MGRKSTAKKKRRIQEQKKEESEKKIKEQKKTSKKKNVFKQDVGYLKTGFQVPLLFVLINQMSTY